MPFRRQFLLKVNSIIILIRYYLDSTWPSEDIFTTKDKWIKADENAAKDFPRLSFDELKQITFGIYQSKYGQKL